MCAGGLASLMYPRVHHVYLVLYIMSQMNTQVYTNKDALRKKRRCGKKRVLFSLRGRDLETAAVNGTKTMKRFLYSTEEVLPGSGSMTLCGSREVQEGGRGVCAFVSLW